MTVIDTDDPLATAAVAAIHSGDLDSLQRLLDEHPELVTARLGDSEHRLGAVAEGVIRPLPEGGIRAQRGRFFRSAGFV